MPLARIELARGRSEDERHAIGDAVHRALVETMAVPPLDRFQVIGGGNEVIYDPNYLGIRRTEDIVVIQVTLSAGRALEQKRALYRTIVANLAELGVRAEDVWINLVEVAKENWSFGLGVASYAPEEKAAA
jgi:phenylpyruvate tautomerase PptA (4-oxalocrotonate tautomerase family)